MGGSGSSRVGWPAKLSSAAHRPGERAAKMPTEGEATFTDEQKEEFKQAFYAFDDDGGGTIGKEELAQLLDALGENLTDEEVGAMMREVDQDGSGVIDFDEFLGMMKKKMMNENWEDEIRDAFNLLDKDGSGLVSASELRHVVTDFCGKLTAEDVNEIMVDADVNADGQLDYHEFLRLMTF